MAIFPTEVFPVAEYPTADFPMVKLPSDGIVQRRNFQAADFPAMKCPCCGLSHGEVSARSSAPPFHDDSNPAYPSKRGDHDNDR